MHGQSAFSLLQYPTRCFNQLTVFLCTLLTCYTTFSMAKGPNHTPLVFHILLKLRGFCIGLVADMEKAFFISFYWENLPFCFFDFTCKID